MRRNVLHMQELLSSLRAETISARIIATPCAVALLLCAQYTELYCPRNY